MHGRRRIYSLAVVALVALSAACTPAAAPATAPTTRDVGMPNDRVPSPPPELDAALAAAWSELQGGPVAQAAAALANVPPSSATSVPGRAAAGFLLLRQGNLPAARDSFGAALSERPDDPEAAYGMAMVAILRGNEELAADWLETALRGRPALTRAAVELRRIRLSAVTPLLRTAEAAQARGDGGAAQSAYREAIELAPDLAGSYLALAALHEADGDIEAALRVLDTGARRAGPDHGVLSEIARIQFGREHYAEAADAYSRLAELRPGDSNAAAMAREARDRFERSALPPEYRDLEERPTITREELAALLAIQLEGLENRITASSAAIVTDVDGRWSTPFVRRVVGWGVLDTYQNNEFYPHMQVRQSMVVEAAYRVLELTGLSESGPRPTLSDPPPEHLLYRPVQALIGYEVLERDADGGIDLLASVSGADALRAIRRLASVVRGAL